MKNSVPDSIYLKLQCSIGNGKEKLYERYF